MTGFVTTLATIWRLAIPYFRSEDAVPGRILLAALVAIELSIVGINVLINQWNARFYNALQERVWDTFVRELLVFCLLAGAYIVLAVYQLYLNQWLQIRWRRSSPRYLGQWLDDGTTIACNCSGTRPTTRTSASPKTSNNSSTADRTGWNPADRARAAQCRGNARVIRHHPGASRKQRRSRCSAG